MGIHTVDAEAHAAAKSSGDYTPEGTPDAVTPAEEGTPKAEETESVISDVDPGDPEAGVEPVKADADKDEEETTEDTEEEKETESEEKSDETVKFDANYEGWTEEFLANGQLSDETRLDVIEKVFHEGVPKEMKEQFVQAYEAGLVSIQAAAIQGAFEIVGGQDSYQSMIGWAQENLSEAEIVAYDADALGDDIVKRDSAIKGLHARMQQATGSEVDFEPNLAHTAGRAQGDPIIGSRQELAKIQATEEYKKDPAVRAKVARQLQQSMDTGKYIS